MEPDNHVPKQLQPYLWKKGVSANPKGRPPGKSLKTFAREYLESLPDDEKIDYLKSLPTEIVWKMAEGNPKNESDVAIKELPIIHIADEIATKNDITPFTEDHSEE